MGRPTPLYHAARLSERVGRRVYLKREDLAHTGAHKINNAVGQALLAKRMGKPRVIAETGAGQHGVAAATACALLGLECVVYMGTEDMRRQAPNVERMHCSAPRSPRSRPGAHAQGGGQRRDPRLGHQRRDDALRDRVCGRPAPYPALVRDLQQVIGDEAREQVLTLEGALPRQVIACVGGVEHPISTFTAFLHDADVELIGVEAGERASRAAGMGPRWSRGPPGVLHGALSSVLADDDGQILEAHSVSAGLDYPGVGPEHAYLRDSGRARYVAVTDGDALAAFRKLARLEGVIPALEPSTPWRGCWSGGPADGYDVLTLSGRGDKDLAEVVERLRKMTERIAAAFETARAEGRAALMPYMMGGFPDRETSAAVADTARRAAPIWSTRDPVLGSAHRRPRDPRRGHPRAGRGRDARLGADGLRAESPPRVPVVPMAYANTALARGPERFARMLADAGAAGAIVPDLPPEERADRWPRRCGEPDRARSRGRADGQRAPGATLRWRGGLRVRGVRHADHRRARTAAGRAR